MSEMFYGSYDAEEYEIDGELLQELVEEIHQRCENIQRQFSEKC